jgi:hypothetical protein
VTRQGPGLRDWRIVVNWFWVNIPLMALFLLATAGIPLWLVFKHPDVPPAVPAPGSPRP